MARGIDLRTNLTAGELDPALYGRTDLKNYFNAAKRIRNALVVPQGGAKRRPGTRYVAETVRDGGFHMGFFHLRLTALLLARIVLCHKPPAPFLLS
jgi:hypothetical protein